MLQITRQGNSIVVKGLDHALYPYSGTLEIPCNSVITVVDESDIVTFRSASNYDVLFSGLVTQITINGETVTKENVGDKFGALSNVNSGGFTPEQEEKLNNAVQISEYNADKEAQSTIDENQNSAIEGLRGNIDGKQDKIDDLNAIREGAEKGATALQNETDPVWTAEKVNYYNKVEVDTLVGEAKSSANSAISMALSAEGIATEANSRANEAMVELEKKANKSEIPSLDGYATEQWVEGKGYLTEHQDISGKLDKTEAASTYQPKGNYATKDEIPSLEGYATEEWVNSKGYLTEHQDISGKLDKTEAASTYQPKGDYLTEETDPIWTAEKGNYYTKTEVDTSLETKADKTEIPSLNGYATEQWVGEQGYLTEHQPLKTINGETIVGNGNIEISSGEETDPVWTAEKVNYYTKAEVDEMIGNINNALATLING